jgi:hypothetical protein
MADERNQQSGGAQQSEAEAFLPELERLTVLRFKLHKHLLEVIRYLGAYDDVGIDVDNGRSGKMAIHQHRLLIGEIREATECTVELPRSERILQIDTALTMATQILEIAGTQVQNALEDGAGDEAVIRYIREAVLRVYNEIADPLNRMAAEVLTRELVSELRDRTEAIEQQIVVAQFLKAGAQAEPDAKLQEQTQETGLDAMRHSPDFRAVKWGEIDFVFTQTQAPVVKALWEAMKNSTPELGQAWLLEAAGSEGRRLKDIFRRHPAFGTLIIKGTRKDTFRLVSPTNKS